MADYGSGIDKDSIEIFSNVRMISWTFDPEQSLILVDTGVTDITGDTAFRLSVSDRSGNTTVEELSTGADVRPGLIFVEQNTPNPFNPATQISFTITSDMRVDVTVFDLLGRRVRNLTDDIFMAGRHSFMWDATDDGGLQVSSGVYIYRVNAGSHSITRKMLFLR